MTTTEVISCPICKSSNVTFIDPEDLTYVLVKEGKRPLWKVLYSVQLFTKEGSIEKVESSHIDSGIIIDAEEYFSDNPDDYFYCEICRSCFSTYLTDTNLEEEEQEEIEESSSGSGDNNFVKED